MVMVVVIVVLVVVYMVVIVVMMKIVVVVIMRVENGPADGLNDGEQRKMVKMMKSGGFIFIREEG